MFAGFLEVFETGHWLFDVALLDDLLNLLEIAWIECFIAFPYEIPLLKHNIEGFKRQLNWEPLAFQYKIEDFGVKSLSGRALRLGLTAIRLAFGLLGFCLALSDCLNELGQLRSPVEVVLVLLVPLFYFGVEGVEQVEFDVVLRKRLRHLNEGVDVDVRDFLLVVPDQLGFVEQVVLKQRELQVLNRHKSGGVVPDETPPADKLVDLLFLVVFQANAVHVEPNFALFALDLITIKVPSVCLNCASGAACIAYGTPKSAQFLAAQWSSDLSLALPTPTCRDSTFHWGSLDGAAPQSYSLKQSYLEMKFLWFPLCKLFRIMLSSESSFGLFFLVTSERILYLFLRLNLASLSSF